MLDHQSYRRERRSGQAFKSGSTLQTTELPRSCGQLWRAALLSAFAQAARRIGVQAWPVSVADEKPAGRDRSLHLLRVDVSRRTASDGGLGSARPGLRTGKKLQRRAFGLRRYSCE